MLYPIFEYHRTMMKAWADEAANALVSPLSPLSYLPGGRNFAACWENLYRLSSACEEPTFGITAIFRDGRVVPVVEQIVSESPFCRLRRFEASAAVGYDDGQQTIPAVLVCAPLAVSGGVKPLLSGGARLSVTLNNKGAAGPFGFEST